MNFRRNLLVAIALAASARADVRPHAGMLRYPDASATHIVFVYANDLWVVPRTGGVATPLASPPGPEAFPRLRAVGGTSAFVGYYVGKRVVEKLFDSVRGERGQSLTCSPVKFVAKRGVRE